MSSGPTLRLEYRAPSESLSEGWHDVLGAAAFHAADRPARCDLPRDRCTGSGSADFPLAHVHAPVLGPVLDDTREVLEVWRIGGPARTDSHGRVRYACGGELLFGSLAVHESEVTAPEESPAGTPVGAPVGAPISAPIGAPVGAPLRTPIRTPLPAPLRAPLRTPLRIAAELAYREMYAALAAAGNPQLVRIWNYLPEINLDTHGLERYRQFNSARHEASLACGRAVAGSVPAASALGAAPGSPFTIYFLASHRAPLFIENPRQVSAYCYPAEYGPRSPSFSRAAVLGEGDQAMLFTSGTASIVGHRTMHAGDAAGQTRETLVNIEALLEEAGRRLGARPLPLETLAYKVYVREPRELPLIRSELEAALGSRAAVLYLKADICRRDLAVEIEAVGGHGWGTAERC